MQLILIPDDRTGRLQAVHGRLRHCFGPPGPYRLLDPVSQLVMGLIGGRTRGAVSAAAFVRLRQRFACWESLRDAPVAEILPLIADVSFAEVKAPRLPAALRMVTARRGALTLDFLAGWPDGAALDWLERLPGVGRKTAATVLNFSTLRKPVLVIDTHHLRVIRRLGLVGPRAGIAEAHDRLTPLLPPGWGAAEIDDHHQLVKTLGQRFCRPSRPACPACPLRALCPQGVPRRG